MKLINDTDDILSEHLFKNSEGINKELGMYFRNKYKELPNCGDDFDLIYGEILDYCKKYDKTIVIDCAQFHCIKDISLLKGTLIIIRTCIDTCYNRTISRYKENNPTYTKEELWTVGKWTMISSLIPFILGILGIIFNW